MFKYIAHFMVFCFLVVLNSVAEEMKIIEERPIVILIYSCDATRLVGNKECYKRVLDSIFEQHYSNYRVIYMDGGSRDNTIKLVEEYIRQKHQENKCSIIKNAYSRGEELNCRIGIDSVKENEIPVFLWENDCLLHCDALSVINNAYKAPKKLVVVIASYNNNQIFEGRERYKRNLDSVFCQKYSNYRVIYVDDCSTDGTANLVEKYVKDQGKSDKVTLIKNIQRWGPSRNRYIGAHYCCDDEIILFLDGDDWFAHENVLNRINEIYADPNVWLTFSHFRTIPNNNLSSGIGRLKYYIADWVINQNAYRENKWRFHSLKTCCAWLFKLIKIEDLLHQGMFFPVSSDLAEMLPMVEMSGGRFRFIREVLYLASQHESNEVNTQGTEMMHRMSKLIMSKKSYSSLCDCEKNKKKVNQEERADLLIFSHDPENLKTLIVSLQGKVQGLGDIYVICDAHKDYKQINEIFPSIFFTDSNNLKFKITEFLRYSRDYIIFALDTLLIDKPINVYKATIALKETFAHAFYFFLDVNRFHMLGGSSCIHLPLNSNDLKDIYIWQFNALSIKKLAYENFYMTLYKKIDVQSFFEKSKDNFSTIDQMINFFANRPVDLGKVGLFWDKSNIFLNQG